MNRVKCRRKLSLDCREACAFRHKEEEEGEGGREERGTLRR